MWFVGNWDKDFARKRAGRYSVQCQPDCFIRVHRRPSVAINLPLVDGKEIRLKSGWNRFVKHHFVELIYG